MSEDYEKQATDFLETTGTKFEIVRIGTFHYFPDDKKPRDVYSVTLTNKRGIYNFRFGDSIRNTERRLMASGSGCLLSPDVKEAKSLGFKVNHRGYIDSKQARAARSYMPSAYDVLACLTSYDPGTFKNFCDDYGYDTDSRKAQATYEAVQDEWDNLTQLFTSEQLEQLAEIQ